MDLFTLLGPLDPDVTPDRCKLHLVTWNGLHDPLDLYLEGVFDEWQSDQNRRELQQVRLHRGLDRDAGTGPLALRRAVHGVLGEEPRDGEDRVHYRTSRRAACDELDGRLVVAFKRTSRQPYPFAEKLASQLTVHAIRPRKQEIAEFPGYRSVRLTKHQLDHIVNARSGSNPARVGGPAVAVRDHQRPPAAEGPDARAGGRSGGSASMSEPRTINVTDGGFVSVERGPDDRDWVWIEIATVDRTVALGVILSDEAVALGSPPPPAGGWSGAVR